jgi:hypothetical protein
MKPIRNLAIETLDNDNGINDRAMATLIQLLRDEGGNEDLIGLVVEWDGRYYLDTSDVRKLRN